MYAGDTAHAVHLPALKFRPDGLLSAATRYPRHGDHGWTPEQSKAGWYSYSERLIDCETGYYVETAESLLDHDSATQVTRAVTRDEQIKYLTSQLQEQQRKWPKNSDVFLACAAASSPAFYKLRLLDAKKPPPLLSEVSLVEKLSGQSDALSALVTMKYDLGRLGKNKQAPASALFTDVRAHVLAWRRATNAMYMPHEANARADAALLAKVRS